MKGPPYDSVGPFFMGSSKNATKTRPALELRGLYIGESEMAGLELRNGRYNLILRFGGQRYVRSLKTGNETEAITKKLRIEETLRLIESGRLEIPHDADFMTYLLSDGKLAKKPKPRTVVSLADLFDRFFQSLPDGNLETTTLKLMQIHRRHLEREIGAKFPVQALTLDDLQRYVSKRAKQKTRTGTLTSTTIKKEIDTFRTVWRWAVDTEHLRGDFPHRGLRLPKAKETPVFQTWAEIEKQIKSEASAELWDALYLSMNEMNLLLEHVASVASWPFIYPMFCTAAFTGARRSELLRSQLSDIDLDANVLTIRERKRVKGQHTSRRVPIAGPLKQALQKWLAVHPGGGYTFCQLEGVPRARVKLKLPTPITADRASHYFKVTLKNSKWQVVKGWHCLRHSFISNCASRGIDQRMIDAWVGHTTDAMRRRYRHLFPNSQREAMELLLRE